MAEIRVRRGRRVEWLAKNPILADGEPGLDTTTRQLKFGDGFTRWNDLPYSGESVEDEGSLADHINSQTPHPVYDDTQSLVLLYENAKV